MRERNRCAAAIALAVAMGLARQAGGDELAYHASADPAAIVRPGPRAESVDWGQWAVYDANAGWLGVANASLRASPPPVLGRRIHLRLDLPLIESRSDVRAGSLLGAVALGLPEFRPVHAVAIAPTLDVGVLTQSLGGGSLRVAGNAIAQSGTQPYYGLSIPFFLRPLGVGVVFWSTSPAPLNVELAYVAWNEDVVVRCGLGLATSSAPLRWFGGVGLKVSWLTELGVFATRVVDDPSQGSVFGLSARIALPAYGRPERTPFPPPPQGADLVTLHEADVRGRDLSALAAPGKVTVVEFGAEWCVPCHAARPELERLAQRPDVAVRVVDVDECPELSHRYDVDTFPTFFVLGRDGQLLVRVEGWEPGAIEGRVPRW
jgi:thioredoxin 1